MLLRPAEINCSTRLYTLHARGDTRHFNTADQFESWLCLSCVLQVEHLGAVGFPAKKLLVKTHVLRNVEVLAVDMQVGPVATIVGLDSCVSAQNLYPGRASWQTTHRVDSVHVQQSLRKQGQRLLQPACYL